MIIAIDAERVFDKFQPPLLIKTLNKPGIDRNFFSLIKGICKTPH